MPDSENESQTLSTPTITSLTNSSSGISIKWKKSSAAEGYYIFRKTSDGKYSKIATIRNRNTVSYTDKAVKSRNGVLYTYKVQAFRSKKVSGSKQKSLLRLTGLKLTGAKNTKGKKLYVKWTGNKKVGGYQLQYATKSSFSGAKIITVKKAKTVTKTISGLKKNKKYYVCVRVYKKSGKTKYYSAWSNTKKVKIKK